jgi:signal transduction histidine kinase
MTLRELYRITTFRLTAVYGLVFAIGVVALLGVVYLQSAVYLTHRVDRILNTQADGLSRSDPESLIPRIYETLTVNGDQTMVLGLFSSSRVWVAGNLRAYPPDLKASAPLEIPPTATFPAYARLIARDLPDGERLVVGRDVNQLREIRTIISWTLLVSGVLILVAGAACATALSIEPLRRVRLLQQAGQDIAAGDLKRRMPVSQRHDELDMFAATVNYMMGEVERLMSEVKGATETIAHDLRTPLTHARAQLHRLQQSERRSDEDIARITAEIDAVLERFRAILRISELEARERRAGFRPTDLGEIVRQVGDLYQPLAEAQGVRLSALAAPGVVVEADPKLLFEAVSNLVDNAIKFTGQKFAGEGGAVTVRLGPDPQTPRIVVEDDGPGVAPDERTAVLQRFYRGERDRLIPGSGLGLSIVAAIVRLHRFRLALEDAGPGLRVVIDCRTQTVAF